MKARSDQHVHAKKVLEEFSKEVSGFVEDLLKDIYEVIGQLLPASSLSLGLDPSQEERSSPFSDLEFVILIVNKQHVAYLKKLVKLLEIRVIHLGERKSPF